MTGQGQEYFETARTWADERDAAARRSRRVAWIVAGAATLVAVLEAVALASVMPLKTVVPLTVLVDRTTGHVERIAPDGGPDGGNVLRADEALQQAMLAQYVIARESYDPISIANAYRKVAIMSDGQARASYLDAMKQETPKSRLGGNGRFVGLETTIKSISPMGQGAALVRFDVSRIGLDGSRSDARPFVATVAYGVRSGPMAFEDRLVNPLGFQVRSYRVSPEAMPAEAAPAAVAAVEQPAP
jgi:type IV secretion system protein VirB8